MVTEVNCPTCNAKVIWSDKSEFRPFCSKRCQLIDLGEWADENHAIQGKSLGDAANDEDGYI